MDIYKRFLHRSSAFVLASGGYSNLGARGKNFQKFMLSEKKKRSDLGLDIFLPKSKCSLKKKKGLPFNFTSNFPIFLPKSRCSLKKKKKVFTSISSLISLFFFQNQGVLQKKKKKKVFTPNRPLSESKTVYAVFEGGPPKKGGPEATASFASPNIHHWS